MHVNGKVYVSVHQLYDSNFSKTKEIGTGVCLRIYYRNSEK